MELEDRASCSSSLMTGAYEVGGEICQCWPPAASTRHAPAALRWTRQARLAMAAFIRATDNIFQEMARPVALDPLGGLTLHAGFVDWPVTVDLRYICETAGRVGVRGRRRRTRRRMLSSPSGPATAALAAPDNCLLMIDLNKEWLGRSLPPATITHNGPPEWELNHHRTFRLAAGAAPVVHWGSAK